MGKSLPKTLLRRAAKAFANDEEHAQRLYDYASKLWFMFSTPVLSNGGTTRGLPISCFLNFVEDSREGLQITTQRMLFSVALAVALVVAGIVYEA